MLITVPTATDVKQAKDSSIRGSCNDITLTIARLYSKALNTGR